MKKIFLFLICALLSLPAVGLADYTNTLKLLDEARAVEASAGDLSVNPTLRQSLETVYQNIIDMLKEELELLTPKTSSVTFGDFLAPLTKGVVQSITFQRLPSGTETPIDISVETSVGQKLGKLSNAVRTNDIKWQVADNFVVGRKYVFTAHDAKGGLLGRSADFTVSSSTASAVSVVTAPVVTTEINYGSIGYWSFDKSSNICVTKGGAITDGEGKNGNGLILNGADAYCVLTDDRIYYPKYFTLALWAKSSLPSASVWGASGWFVSGRDQSGYVVGPVKNSRDVKFTIFDDTNLVQNSYVLGTVTPESISEWHHYAMTYDGKTASIYLDGELVSSTSTVISRSYAGTKDIYFGLDDSADQAYGTGALDEIRLYNRALSACEIHYLAGKGCASVVLSKKANMASVVESVR